jgi:hypothetical protein
MCWLELGSSLVRAASVGHERIGWSESGSESGSERIGWSSLVVVVSTTVSVETLFCMCVGASVCVWAHLCGCICFMCVWAH